MKKYNTLILIMIVGLFNLVSGYSQKLIQNKKFNYITTFNSKVVFLKEIPLINSDKEYNYFKLKEWGKENYSDNILLSKIRYDNKNREIIVKSRVELILPENSEGIRESLLMIYKLSAFILDNKCILEIKDLIYNSPERTTLRSFKSEELITDEAIAKDDDLREFRINTRKATLYFLNELADELTKALNK